MHRTEMIEVWRQAFKEGWACAECGHKRVVVIAPDGYIYDESLPPPIPQRMCMAGGALQCPEVIEAMTEEE